MARIEDLGYRRYRGPRSATGSPVVSLARSSALRALGRKRSWWAKLVPIALTLVAFGPALVLLGLRALFPTLVPGEIIDQLPYEGYYAGIGTAMMVFAATVIPELLCPDRRERVLSLYLATAVSRTEYVVAKTLAALVPMLLVTTAPVLFLWVGNAIFAVDSVDYARAHLGDLWRLLVAGPAIAVFYGLLGLALASLTTRRAFAVGAYVIVVLATTALSGILEATVDERLAVTAVGFVPIAVAGTLWDSSGGDFGPSATLWRLAWLAGVGLSLAVLAWRYRKAE